MTDTIARFEQLLIAVPRRLAELDEADVARKPAPGRWSKKEILGHLIDSAGNNHQRFVRAQRVPLLDSPTYEQELWVSAQAYATEPWADLVNLWLLLNRHLLHIVKAMPGDVLGHQLVIGGRPAVTLEFVVADYLRHVDNHVAQLLR